ncbi:sulfotransferase family 2 domain-containing protein [Microcoleus sp. Pol14C6]|uniref:sulfotransferase family 2 domain-containing protein n=1 Tax=unclassified Microcoleus TaxID=2642155 RepID=UPI002FD4BDEF
MRISHHHKFIYISKPKSASESIRQALDAHSDIFSDEDFYSPYYHHTTLRQLKKHFNDMGWDFNSYFKFTSLRNPWDMAVSLYFYNKVDINGLAFWHNSPDYKPQQLMSFKEWVLKENMAWFHTLQNFILDENGNNMVDYVVRVENLNCDLDLVASQLGIKLNCPHLNKTSHKKYSEYYDEQTKEMIAKVFKFDIEYGGYEF